MSNNVALLLKTGKGQYYVVRITRGVQNSNCYFAKRAVARGRPSWQCRGPGEDATMEGADAFQALQAHIAALVEKNNTLEEENKTLKEEKNTLKEENKTLKEDKTVLEKDNSIATARADFGRCDYSTKSFAEILVLIASCQFPDVPQSVLDNYVQQEGASNTSREYIDSSASHVTAHQQGATTLQISKIRLHMMQNTKSKVTLMELELDETELEGLVSDSLFNSDDEAMNNFVTEQSATLQELRKAFYFRFNDSDKIQRDLRVSTYFHRLS